jgi:hypothetical protein
MSMEYVAVRLCELFASLLELTIALGPGEDQQYGTYNADAHSHYNIARRIDWQRCTRNLYIRREISQQMWAAITRRLLCI